LTSATTTRSTASLRSRTVSAIGLALEHVAGEDGAGLEVLRHHDDVDRRPRRRRDLDAGLLRHLIQVEEEQRAGYQRQHDARNDIDPTAALHADAPSGVVARDSASTTGRTFGDADSATLSQVIVGVAKIAPQ
jgi:hypothetical protein